MMTSLQGTGASFYMEVASETGTSGTHHGGDCNPGHWLIPHWTNVQDCNPFQDVRFSSALSND